MPPIVHSIRGSLCTYELSSEILGIIHEAIAFQQLPDEQNDYTTRNFGFCNCLLQLKSSCMQHMQLQICVVA